ncbi:hypothetical protein J1N35_029135 [Gossypium stocksii]|uniref:Uncharacterized protein n=1 Tax=Gossypium stocksii TaxID=47602 RepID=A0A9D3ZSW0_9ROSI|nr:hypothetical protein J1N35_029135 [Gossypium stocksii]
MNAEEKYVRQKSKIQSVKASDHNTAYFHQIVAAAAASIRVLKDSSRRSLNTHNQIANELELLGINISDSLKDRFTRRITAEEIKATGFAMNGEKALRPDGTLLNSFKHPGILCERMSLKQYYFLPTLVHCQMPPIQPF